MTGKTLGRIVILTMLLNLGVSTLLAETGERLCVGIRSASIAPGDPLSLGLSFGVYCTDGSSIVRAIPSSSFKEKQKKQIEARAVKSLSSDLREVARINVKINPGMVRALPVYSEQPLPRGASICLLFEKPNLGRSAPIKSLGCTTNSNLREVIDPLSPHRLSTVKLLERNGFDFEGKAIMPIYSFGKTYRARFGFYSRY